MDGRERSPELMVGLRGKSSGGCCLEIVKLNGDLGMAVVSRAFLWVCCCCLCSSVVMMKVKRRMWVWFVGVLLDERRSFRVVSW